MSVENITVQQLPCDLAIPSLGYRYPRKLKTYVHTKKLYINVHRSIIYNSPN